MEMTQQRWVNVTDMNTKGDLFGGRMLSWVDEDSSIFAYDTVITSSSIEQGIELITAGMYSCQFILPVKLADRLVFNYKIAHVGNASLTIVVRVLSKNQNANCFFGLITYVGIAGKLPCKIAHRLRDVDIEALEKEPVWKYVEKCRKISKQGLK